MSSELNTICSLINNKENLQDEKAFKLASATLICDVVHNVIDANKKDQKKYCKLFQTQFNISEKELNGIKNDIDKNAVNEKIAYIKEELNNNKFEIMEFLKIVNRFIVADGCNAEGYRQFETIRDSFLKEFY
ncbi:MAG: Unknown protein [uncultured Sulfurovum sp.]|uniref:Uncharacterized protein n=1 Tax=uncultured Sulfurovum sp. TaxID=269237 RepID=A0A6S6SMF1_9BACT|nr:MAG: Unknown protein [uncultured Sulfurovum sp.]